MAQVTTEKFDGDFEVAMLARIAEREAQVENLKELERRFLGNDAKFKLSDVVKMLVDLRFGTLEVLDAVKRWRSRLVKREPCRWRERDGTYVNYLLKALRDTERYLRSFDFPKILGLAFGQRNPFMMPQFGTKVKPARKANVKKMVPVRGTVMHAELLEHVTFSHEKAYGMMGQDVPRVWWISDEDRRRELWEALVDLSEVHKDPVLLHRIIEAHVYLKQEEAASEAKSHQHKAAQAVTARAAADGAVAAYEDDEAASAEWGLEAWVRMPWGCGPFPLDKAVEARRALEAKLAQEEADRVAYELLHEDPEVAPRACLHVACGSPMCACVFAGCVLSAVGVRVCERARLSVRA